MLSPVFVRKIAFTFFFTFRLTQTLNNLFTELLHLILTGTILPRAHLCRSYSPSTAYSYLGVSVKLALRLPSS